jgi:hypothetical protein
MHSPTVSLLGFADAFALASLTSKGDLGYSSGSSEPIPQNQQESGLISASVFPMRVVITGGCGFLGQMLAGHILEKGSLVTHRPDGTESHVAVTQIILADVARPPKLLLAALEAATMVSVVLGDVSDATFCQSLCVGADALSIFHLGAVMSGKR